MIKRVFGWFLVICLTVGVAVATIVHRDFKHEMDFVGDTLADTASGDGLTNLADTIGLFHPLAWNTILFRAVIGNPYKDTLGIGDDDSVYWRLTRTHWGTSVVVASESALIPDTFKYYLSGANDTTVRGDWSLIVLTRDTLTAARITTKYPIEIEWEAVPIEQ